MTPIPFTLTEADMLAGNRLAIRRYIRNGALRFVIGVIAVSAGVTMIAFAFAPRPFADAMTLFAEILAIYTALAIALGVFIVFVAPKQRAKKNFKQMPALRRGQSVVWDDAAIAFTSEYGNASIPFADLHQWAADDEIVIIYPADHLFYMLPARVFATEGDRDALIAALEASPVKRI
jgi:YcxB-like protein